MAAMFVHIAKIQSSQMGLGQNNNCWRRRADVVVRGVGDVLETNVYVRVNVYIYTHMYCGKICIYVFAKNTSAPIVKSCSSCRRRGLQVLQKICNSNSRLDLQIQQKIILDLNGLLMNIQTVHVIFVFRKHKHRTYE